MHFSSSVDEPLDISVRRAGASISPGGSDLASCWIALRDVVCLMVYLSLSNNELQGKEGGVSVSIVSLQPHSARC